jgi:hypothetical protein
MDYFDLFAKPLRTGTSSAALGQSHSSETNQRILLKLGQCTQSLENNVFRKLQATYTVTSEVLFQKG